MGKQFLKVEERDLSKMLVSVIPMEFKPSEFRAQTESILREIKRLPKLQKTILKAAYVFSRKVPRAERRDLFQELTCKLLESQVKNESWAYTIARCDWLDWYRKYKVHSQYSELDIEGEVANQLGINRVALHELEKDWPEIREAADTERANVYNRQAHHIAVETLTGLMEYERLDNRLSADSLLTKIPADIQRIGSKRMAGIALNAVERQKLCRYIKRNPEIVSQYQAL